MSQDETQRDEGYVRDVRSKADRLSRARERGGGFWRHVAHVGSLGFVFALPLVAGALAGHVLAERTGHRSLAIALLLLGLVTGALASWRLIRQGIADRE